METLQDDPDPLPGAYVPDLLVLPTGEPKPIGNEPVLKLPAVPGLLATPPPPMAPDFLTTPNLEATLAPQIAPNFLVTSEVRTVPILRIAPDLLVVIPYFNRPDTIQRAVESVLSQTFGNIELLIVDDASDIPARDVVAPDPRIKFFDMKQNGGRYFIDAVASRANPYAYYMPHDSDDASVPERLGLLRDRMGRGDVDVVYNLVHRINLDGTEKTMSAEPFHSPIDREKMVHRACHSALYRGAVLLDSGGYHPGFRVGYDTFMINVLKLVAKTSIVEEPLYMVHKTADSLTMSPETGLDSPYRARVRGRLTALFHRCFDSPAETKTIIEGSIAQRTKAQMHCEIRRMKKELGWS